MPQGICATDDFEGYLVANIISKNSILHECIENKRASSDAVAI